MSASTRTLALRALKATSLESKQGHVQMVYVSVLGCIFWQYGLALPACCCYYDVENGPRVF